MAPSQCCYRTMQNAPKRCMQVLNTVPLQQQDILCMCCLHACFIHSMPPSRLCLSMQVQSTRTLVSRGVILLPMCSAYRSFCPHLYCYRLLMGNVAFNGQWQSKSAKGRGTIMLRHNFQRYLPPKALPSDWPPSCLLMRAEVASLWGICSVAW